MSGVGLGGEDRLFRDALQVHLVSESGVFGRCMKGEEGQCVLHCLVLSLCPCKGKVSFQPHTVGPRNY